jgi:predicted transcriptional regulator
MVIELTGEDQSRLTAMAAFTQRSEADLAREAMHWFLRATESHSELIASSRKQIAENRTVDHDALFAEIEGLLEQP